MYYNLLTYNRMSLSSMSEIDSCLGKDTNTGDLLLRYDASQFINLNKVVDNFIDIDSRISLLECRIDVKMKIEELEQQNYELQQRLERLEFLLQEN